MKNSILKAFAVILGFSISLNAISQTKPKTQTPATKTTTTKPVTTKKTTTTPAKTIPAATTKKETVKADSSVKAESVKTVTVQDEPGILAKHSKAVQKIFKNEKGVFRGYDFGTPLDAVKKSEDAQYVADGKDFAIYKLFVNDNEEVEILYYLDEKRNIKGFGIEFPVHISKKEEADLIEDLQNYFNERFGKYTVNDDNEETWTSKDGVYTIEMGNSSEAADMLEIEVDIFKK
jgi:hypothetical protein